jgi:hypothetical protein
VREYQVYRRRLRQVLAIEPSPELGDLLARPLIPRQATATIDLQSRASRDLMAGT